MESDWKKTTIGELFPFTYGKSLPANKRDPEGLIPVYGSGGISGYHSESLVDKQGIIIGRKGTVGSIIYSRKPFWPIDTTFYITASQNYDLLFAYYLLQTLRLNEMNSDSAVPGLNRDTAHSVSFLLPPVSEQKRIADILGTLDEKIELNRQMNATLEAMAQALFKSWFVDFDPVIDNTLAAGNPIPESLQARAEMRKALGAQHKPLPDDLQQQFPDRFVLTDEMGWVPDGWNVGPIQKLADLNPESWSSQNFPQSIKYVDLANTKNGKIDLVTIYSDQDAPSRAKRILRKFDTIIGTVRPGNRSFAYVNQDGLTGSTGFAVMRPKVISNRTFVYLFLTQNDVIETLAHLADGGAYPAVRPEVVANQVCTYPDINLLKAFDKLASPFFQIMAEQQFQCDSLSKIRNTLIPKLLSGELRVPEVESIIDKQLAEA